MKLLHLVPMLRTKDLRGTVEFYTDVLGFTCAAASEEFGWASLQRDSVELMVALPNAHEPFDEARFTGSLYFHCEDVDVAWKRLAGRARVCYPPETFDYGMREFAIYDNNGYLLQFGQPVR
jgi:uncharacterized glyoxalase superfamily protein PhnB